MAERSTYSSGSASAVRPFPNRNPSSSELVTPNRAWWALAARRVMTTPHTTRKDEMAKALGLLAALVLVVAACSASSEPDPNVDAGPSTSGLPSSTTTTAPTPVAEPTTTTTAAFTSTLAPTTTVAAGSSTTTAPMIEANPPDVEAWWCAAIGRAAAAGSAPQDFAQDFDDDLRYGYTDAPVETVEQAAAQLERVQCDPDYARAVADALVG
jgi:hypothetical protein